MAKYKRHGPQVTTQGYKKVEPVWPTVVGILIVIFVIASLAGGG